MRSVKLINGMLDTREYWVKQFVTLNCLFFRRKKLNSHKHLITMHTFKKSWFPSESQYNHRKIHESQEREWESERENARNPRNRFIMNFLSTHNESTSLRCFPLPSPFLSNIIEKSYLTNWRIYKDQVCMNDFRKKRRKTHKLVISMIDLRKTISKMVYKSHARKCEPPTNMNMLDRRWLIEQRTQSIMESTDRSPISCINAEQCIQIENLVK